jgi:hypothetical protein
VTVIWNGTVVTGPVLIYQDEIAVYPNDLSLPSLSSLDDPGSGTVFCRSATSTGVAWYLVDGTKVSPSVSTAFRHGSTSPGVIPSESVLVRYMDSTVSSDNHNGLWTCQLNEASFPVGVYQRGGGKSVACSNNFTAWQGIEYRMVPMNT